jgi:orotidine-5'-phosphate decarboxylase
VRIVTAKRGDRTIVALDVGSRRDAIALVDALDGLAGMFKVGLQLFLAEGPDLVRTLVDRGQRVFLDLKLHDIPNTVAMASLEAARLGVSMLTVHAAGGSEMISAASGALAGEFGSDKPILAAVTVLTSMDDAGLEEIGIDASPKTQVSRLAEVAREGGADGLVCSPSEVRELRGKLGPSVTLVTPGVRMPGQAADDQKRIATPAQALADGADWVVVGRYVNRAARPREALLEVIGSLS